MFNKITNMLQLYRMGNLQKRFSLIYRENIFGGQQSRSGEGSNMVQTAEIRRVLPELMQELQIGTFLDAPCGDWFWMREMELGVKRYIGADIVEELVQDNQKKFGDEKHSFICRNLASDDLPYADLIFCRDCLVHLNYADVMKVLANFKRSGSKYLLTTTFVDRQENKDLVGRDIWRTLNLQAAPFNFPQPLRLINEQCTEADSKFTDKSLGLWLLADIKTE